MAAVGAAAATPEVLSSVTDNSYMHSSPSSTEQQQQQQQQQQQMRIDDGGESSNRASDQQQQQQQPSATTVLSGVTKKKKKKPGMSDVDDDAANEKTGRWTDEEHARFLQGLELFGKKWTKVADIVGTRTTVQVRSHAQKYFQKLEKDRATPNSSSQSASADRGGKAPAVAASSRVPVEHVSYESRGAEATQKDDRSTSGPVAVPTVLKRFMPDDVVASGRASAPQLAGALFKFLTPRAMPNSSSSSSSFDNNKGGVHGSDDEAATVVPDWYRRGGKIHELLDEAAALDWRDDSGGDRISTEEDDDDDRGDRSSSGRRDNAAEAANRSIPLQRSSADGHSLAPSSAPPVDGGGRGGAAPLSRISSFDALCNASLIAASVNSTVGASTGGVGAGAANASGTDGRKRALSQGSEGLPFDDESLFYDDALYFDDPSAPASSSL